ARVLRRVGVVAVDAGMGPAGADLRFPGGGLGEGRSVGDDGALMTSTHGEALGWPRRPVRNTWDDPRWSSVFEGRSHLGWPHDASGLRVEASREVTSAAAGDRDVSRKTEGVASAATGDRDVSRETEQDENVPVSRETSAGLNGSSG